MIILIQSEAVEFQEVLNLTPVISLFERLVCINTVRLNVKFNLLPSLTLQSARNLNVACRPKRSKALFFVLFVIALRCVNETEALCCRT